MKYTLAVIVLMVVAIPASAATDGNELLQSCQIAIRFSNNGVDRNANAVDSYRHGICLGLVEGIAMASPRICPTKGVTTIQSVRVVVKYLQDHPEKLNLADVVLIETALAQAFPCDKG